MQEKTSPYPNFIVDKPVGKDCFDGHSQEYLAHSIYNYVRMTDATTKTTQVAGQKKNISLPRIIGLEGGWGSGKSNVVSMVEMELAKDGYYTFTYDAWGHQEDLQRRSILETMTGQLIKDEVLQGEVEIPMRNGKKNKAKWTDQLSLLLSNKTTTIRRSVPHLSGAAVCGICLVAAFTVLTVISGILLDNVCCFPVWAAIILDLIPIFIGLCVSVYFRYKDGDWNRTLSIISQQEDDTIDEEYTSSEEPSVAEFKNWMRAISDYLGGDSKRKYRKLVIVFDNMDRLPSEKVMQLWSSIYSFFAGGEFENVWTLIPYDYKHLCEAIYGCEDNDDKDAKDAERIKQFISKTFPISYHVPQPVITDYEKLFYTYFDLAFGKEEHDREHICQVFMHLNPHANPRTVIRFVNELVALRNQWSDATKYRLQNLALYALKKDYIHYEGDSEDAQLLSKGLFDKIGAFYPEQEKVRIELCQYAYGLEDEKLAKELPLRNELKRIIEAGGTLDEYAGQDNFLSVLEDVLNDVDVATVDNAVKSMASLDGTQLTDERKNHIQSKWDLLANVKRECRYDKHQYDETLTILINHATEKRVNELAKAYAKTMQGIVVTDGSAYFKTQNRLQQALKEAKVKFDDAEWYKVILCNADQFVMYICEAKKEYKHYGLTCDIKELNEYLLNGAMSGNSLVTTVVDYINDDDGYDLSELRNGLSKTISEDSIKQNISVAAYVHRVLDKGKGVLSVRFSKETVAGYLNVVPAPWDEEQPVGQEDVIAMSLADGKDINNIDDRMIPRVCECMDRYLDYTEVLKHTGKEGSAFRKLNLYCIKHEKGILLNMIYTARHLHEIEAALGIDIGVMLKQFNRWPAVEWGELNVNNGYVKEVKSYVHSSLLSAYRDNPGNFSNSIISLGVAALSLQEKGYLVKQQVQGGRITVLIVDDYWREFVKVYLGTKYLENADEKLTGEAVTILQWLYDRNELREQELLDTILKYSNEARLRSYLHTMMNENFVKTDITKEKFLYFGKLLPMLGADMDANTARGLITHFIKPIYNDAGCAAIINKYNDFYLSIIRIDITIAAAIVKDMLGKEEYSAVAEDLRKMTGQEED